MISWKKLVVITIIVIALTTATAVTLALTGNTQWIGIVITTSLAVISATASVFSGDTAYSTLQVANKPFLIFTIIKQMYYGTPTSDYYLQVENKGNNHALDIELHVKMLFGQKGNDKVNHSEVFKLPSIVLLEKGQEKIILHLNSVFPGFYNKRDEIIRTVLVTATYKNMLGQKQGGSVTLTDSDILRRAPSEAVFSPIKTVL